LVSPANPVYMTRHDPAGAAEAEVRAQLFSSGDHIEYVDDNAIDEHRFSMGKQSDDDDIVENGYTLGKRPAPPQQCLSLVLADFGCPAVMIALTSPDD
jgi:hypothetical protein